jgi:hypothetical protein
MSHFKNGISKDISEFAIDDAFLESRYLFTRREGKKQFAYCTHCKNEFDSTNNKLRHQPQERRLDGGCFIGRMSMSPPPKPVICPHCGSQCKVKSSGIRRTSLVDPAYFIYFEKSRKDPKVIVARGFIAIRDYSKDYHDVKTQYLEVTRYIFEMGGSKMFSTAGEYWNHRLHGVDSEWFQRKSVFIENRFLNLGLNYSLESIMDAVEGTQFQYSCWENYYRHYDMIKFMDLYSRYPCIEYLDKFGFEKLVETRLKNECTYKAINWRGKTVFKVLRLNKKELNEIKTNGLKVDCYFLHLIQLSKKDGSNLTPTEVAELGISNYCESYLLNVLKYLTFRKVANYIQKQTDQNPKRFKKGSDVLNAWDDYMRDCGRLMLDTKDIMVAFPKDLHKAHQNMIKQINIKADAELQVQIAEKAKLLKKLYYKHQGLLIRPAQTADELINEGKALNHCVGNYAPDFARGLKIILFVRKADDPATPYYTVEVRKKTIIQIRGKNNCSPSEDVKEFIEAFKEAKLVDKRERERIRIPA